MGGKPWTLAEERQLAGLAGLVPVKSIASILGRSEDSVRTKAKELRGSGRLSSTLRVERPVEYVSDLRECPRCEKLRSKFDGSGVCRVCVERERFDKYRRDAEKAYWAMPRELRERSTCGFDVERRPELMSRRRDGRPKPPDIDGLDEFYTAKAMDDYALALETYELDLARLDVDAMKQRKSKWLRKAKAYRKERS